MRKGFCEVCGPPRKAEFTICRVTRSGRRAERSLCGICAKDAERIALGDTGFPLTDLFTALVTERSGAGIGQNRTKVCPSCGNTEKEATEAGMVGCPLCYSVFRDEIAEVIRKLHGPDAARGLA